MRVGVLGPLEVTDDGGRPVRVGGQRVRALLILLALDAGRTIPAATLIDRLWEQGGTVNALQSLVSRLRSALGSGAIESSPAGYRLGVPPQSIDAVEFERAARDGARTLAGGDPRAAAETLRNALGLWRGTALADVADAPFAAGEARRLEERRAAATLDRIEADLLLGADVVPELRALTDADPLAERPRALLMRALAAAGRQAAALAEYRQARELLAAELGADPSPQLERAHLDILRQENYPERTLVPARFPSWLTSFVGREEDVAEVLKKLGDERLVTLTGPGGIGKTRLAAEVAARLGTAACFTELAPVTDPGDVPRAVLGALGIGSRAIGFAGAGQAAPAADPLDRVCDALARRDVVLILDNCEHVIEAAAALAERILAGCPRVRILATSREPLRIGGEALRLVPPLPGPAAAELLRDRAAAVRPGFTATNPDADVITRICQTLDGMPLAIELASAWLRTLTPAQLAERLDDRFGLLTSGARTALPRHQTLRAVVDWSWDLLSPPERILARRLSVFPAGATLRAAERICADTVLTDDTVLFEDAVLPAPVLPDTGVLPALDGLVAKSILTVADDGETDPRYRMLETVRAYCAQHLAEAGEDTRVRDALADYYLDLAETSDPLLRTREQRRWFAEFTAEQDNLHAALRWAITRGDAETALRFVRALAYYWVQHGLGDGHALTADVLAMEFGGARRSRAAELSRTLGEARVICSFLAAGPGFDLAAVRPAITEALGELDEITGGDTELHPVAALLTPMLALYEGDPERAIALFRRYITAEDPVLRGMGLFYVARFSGQLGRVDEAEEDTRASLAEIRSLGDRFVIAITLMYLAEFAELRADHAAAIEMLAEGRAVGAELGGHWVDLWYIDGMLALVRGRAGDFAGARADLAQAASTTSCASGDAGDAAAWLRSVEAELAWRTGDLHGARRCYADVLAAIKDRPAAWWHPAQILASAGLARTGLALGDAARCRSLLAGALRLAAAWYEHPPLAAVLDATAAYAFRAGSAETAAKLLGAAHTIRGVFDESSMDAPRTRQAARDALGPAAFTAAYASGRALSRDGALSLAESTLVPVGGGARGG